MGGAGVALLLLGGASAAWGQDAAAAEGVAEVVSPDAAAVAPELAVQSLRLDLLLGDVSAVRRAMLKGPVWAFEPESGRELVVLPIAIDPEVSGVTLDDPAFSIQSARFIGWVLPDGAPDARRGSRDTGPTDAALLDLGGLLMKADGEAAMMKDDALEVAPDMLPEGAPLATRSLELLPGGRMAWMAGRALPGVVQASANPPTGLDGYRLKLDPEQVRAMKPERPARPARTAGEDRRVYDLRVRAVNEVFRSQSTGFRAMTEAVRALPQRFEARRPAVVCAVFETSAAGDLVVRGHAAGRWAVPRDILETLGRLATAGGVSRGGSRGAAPGLTAEQAADVALLGRVAADEHPWSKRAAAQALAGSGYLAAAGSDANDAVGAVARRLLAAEDPVVRNRTVYALARLESASPGVVSLLAAASAGGGGPAVDAVAVRAYLAMKVAGEAGAESRGREAVDLAAVQRVVNAANQMLQAADGPDAGAVVREVLAAAGDAALGGRGRGRGDDEGGDPAATLIDGVSFAGLSADRFGAAAAAVVDSAGRYPVVAGGWLNRQLLGSTDPGQVEQTLDLLNVVLDAASTSGAGDGGAVDRVEQATKLSGGLPLDSAGHALLAVLGSSDALLRQKGWQALSRFVLPDGRGRSASTGDDPEAVLEAVLNAALVGDATPASLVPFLVGQTDADPVGRAVTRALVRVIVQGDARSGQQAARALLGAKRRVAEALDVLDADGRGRFAARLYDRLEGSLSPVTGLIRAEGATLTRFLGDALAQGELPGAVGWAQAAGREQALYGYATGSDDALARAAIAGLAALAGADTPTQLAAVGAFDGRRRGMAPDAFGAAWAQVRQVIFTGRLAQAAGDYRLVVVLRGRRQATADSGGLASDPVLGTDPGAVRGNTDADGAGAGEAEHEERHVLGVVELVADGGTVRLGGGTPEITVPDDHLAIRLPNAGDLKDLAVEALQDLPLERIVGPLDLLPDGHGGWAGQADLVDGRGFELRLEPHDRDAAQ